MLTETFSEIVSAVPDACKEVYGDRLIGVVLFGSVARQRMRADSDIDVLVVADPLPEGRMARMAERDDVERLCGPALERARRDRLAARGAIRASFRGMPYWILEPNVRRGQVVEI